MSLFPWKLFSGLIVGVKDEIYVCLLVVCVKQADRENLAALQLVEDVFYDLKWNVVYLLILQVILG